LSLVLMDTLDLNVDESLAIGSDSEVVLDVVKKSTLVLLLDGSPLLTESFVLDVLLETLEFREIGQPVFRLERFGNKSSESRVCLE